MHFLTFLPHCSPDKIEERAKACNLLDLLGGHNAVPNLRGPHDLPGVMIAHMTDIKSRHDYSPSEQEWVPSIQKIDGAPAYYVGFWLKDPPRENELRRHYTQSGRVTQLGGVNWKLPTPTTVDARAVYEDDGSMRWETIRQFSWMCDEAQMIRVQYLEDFGTREVVFRVEPSSQVNWLLKLLRVNYRLLPEVAVRLDLWTGKDHIIDTFLDTLELKRKANGR